MRGGASQNKPSPNASEFCADLELVVLFLFSPDTQRQIANNVRKLEL